MKNRFIFFILLLSTYFYLISMQKKEANNDLILFFQSLEVYLSNKKNLEQKQVVLDIYKSLHGQAKTIAKQHLIMNDIKEEPVVNQSKEFHGFKLKLQEWQRTKTSEDFSKLLEQFNKLHDQDEKSQATNIIQGILSEYKDDSVEYKNADKVLAKEHDKQLKIQKEYLLNLKAKQQELLKRLSLLQEKEDINKAKNTLLKYKQEVLIREIKELNDLLLNLKTQLVLEKESENLDSTEREYRELLNKKNELLKAIKDLKKD